MRQKRLVVVLALLLTGCSASPEQKVPEVVTLQSPAGGTATTAAVPAAPVIRPDTTYAEQDRMRQPWMKCLQEHGIPMRTTEAGLLDIDAGGNTKETNGRILAETKPGVKEACDKLRPVLAPELDEAKNPYWADDDDNFHKCLVAHGDPLVKKDGEWVPGPGWNDYEPDDAMELACQVEAYDGKKG